MIIGKWKNLVEKENNQTKTKNNKPIKTTKQINGKKNKTRYQKSRLVQKEVYYWFKYMTKENRT